MSRRRFRQVRTADGGHELVDVTELRPSTERYHLIQPDLAPYQSVVTGEPIDGRRAHREHLAAHGAEETGDQLPQFLREAYERDGVEPTWGRDGRRVDI